MVSSLSKINDHQLEIRCFVRSKEKYSINTIIAATVYPLLTFPSKGDFFYRDNRFVSPFFFFFFVKLCTRAIMALNNPILSRTSKVVHRLFAEKQDNFMRA